MKLIDEKGKLFGIVNIVDLLIVGMVVAIVGAGLYVFVFRGNQTLDLTGDEDVYITVVSRLQPQEVADSLSIGDKLVARNAFQDAEIVSIDITPAIFVAWTDEGEAVNTFHPIWKDISVVIKDKTSPTSPILKVGGQEVRVGKTFTLKTQEMEIPSLCYNIEFR